MKIKFLTRKCSALIQLLQPMIILKIDYVTKCRLERIIEMKQNRLNDIAYKYFYQNYFN